MSLCKHNWEPIPRWMGRYICSNTGCRVIAYRGVVVSDGDVCPVNPSNIIPYKCRCGNDASFRDHKRKKNSCVTCDEKE